MDFTSAVSWWAEWQLRIFVLSSLFLQLFLCVTSRWRKYCIPSWLRLCIWLAYLGSDAVAIYALAALFNLHKKDDWVSTNRGKALQVLWAPILLVHLGGQSGITAYNIEDNELWKRHVLTSVSQVTVAIYVFVLLFTKSPRLGDTKFLGTAVCLFLVGVLKCILKPWDFKRVSINSLVNSEKAEIYSLQKYVEKATDYLKNEEEPKALFDGVTNNLCVDMALPYSHRLHALKIMASPGSPVTVLVDAFLSSTFDRLYTKKALIVEDFNALIMARSFRWGPIIRLSCLVFTILAIIVFSISRKEAFEGTDVKITYILLCLTAAIEYLGPVLDIIHEHYDTDKDNPELWHGQLAQCNLVGYLAHNKRHERITKMSTLLMCKDYLDQLWFAKTSVPSAKSISALVHAYLREAWTKPIIKDFNTYRAFNNNRGQQTLDNNQGCSEFLYQSIGRPFDESVLLWHLATDFCFYQAEEPSHEEATRSREMSNYMLHLLFDNPEMLMPGARRSLFTDTYDQLSDLRLVTDASNHQLSDKTPDEMQLNERELVQEIIIPNAQSKTKDSDILHDAWQIANDLNSLPGGDIWKVIQGVWVEMLCFSAGRCRAYLHVKTLGTGGEYLSSVWMLRSLMGMPTLAETMRIDMPMEGQNGGGAAGPRSASPSGDENV